MKKKVLLTIFIVAVLVIIVGAIIINSNRTNNDGGNTDGTGDNGGSTGGSSDSSDGGNEEPPFHWNGERLNFIIILTDDQRADTIWAMPNVQRELVEKGFTFNKAFATTPLCCPSRSGLLTGFNAYDTHIMNNFPPKGGATAFDDTKTINLELKKQGYTTGLMGKYLNNYFEAMAPYIPPGWDTFVDVEKGNWFKYDYARGSSTLRSSTGQILHSEVYNTYFIRDEALDFIEENSDRPFFLYWAPKAPHGPATAAPEDLDEFLDYEYDSPAIHEIDLSDKPEYVRNKEYSDEDDEGDSDHEDFPVKQLQSIQAVDRSIKEIIDKLEEEKILNKTVIIFVGDNGYMWGEHGMWKKGQPYEESIHVPLVIRMPTVEKGSTDEIVGMNIDIPTMILQLANIDKETDGKNLYPLMTQNNVAWREGLVLQYWGNRPFDLGSENAGTTDWAAWRTKEFKYVEYVTGEKEFYDLINDPYELESQHDNPAYESIMQKFSNILEEKAGITLLESVPPEAPLKSPYSYKFQAVWGKQPYKWYVTEEDPYAGNKDVPEGITCLKRLPIGLSLTQDGRITGTPTEKEACALIIAVETNSISPYTNKPHIYKIRVKMQVAHK